MSALLLDLALKSTLLLAAAFAIAQLLRNSSAAARHLLWSLAFAALLLLPLLTATLPAWHILPTWSAPPNPVPELPTSIAPPRRPLPAGSAGQRAITPTPSSPIPPTPSSQPPLAPPSPIQHSEFRTQNSLLPLYLLGLALSLLPLLAAAFSLLRLERRAQPLAHAPWPALLKSLTTTLAIRRPITLLQSPTPLTMPMTWGLARPRILLPAAAHTWPPERQRLVLLHELAHIKRRDTLTQLLARLLCAIYWFHPLAWLALHQLRIEAERACDDLVLTADTHTKPSAYAAELLATVSAHRPLPFSAPAIAMARRNNPQLHARIRAILDHARNRRRLTHVTISLCALATCFAVTVLACCQTQATAPPAIPAPSIASTSSSRMFTDVQLFINNARYGPDNGCTGPLAATGSMTCGHPGAVSEVTWKFINATPTGDRYEFTRKFPSDATDLSTVKITTKTITYAGQPLVIFEDAVQKISIADFPHPVHFTLGDSQFLPGDTITITEIRGTADTITPNNTYQIKGTYTLASQDAASLATYVTSPIRNDPHHDPYDPRQTVSIKKGAGTFTVVLPFLSKGYPHLSFYPTNGGSSFSALYFGTGDSLYKTNTPKRVLILVSPAGISFEGQPTTWNALPARLEKIPDRPNTILAFAFTSDQMTIADYHAAFAHISELAKQFHFKYTSDTGIKTKPDLPPTTTPHAQAMPTINPSIKTVFSIHNGKVRMQNGTFVIQI